MGETSITSDFARHLERFEAEAWGDLYRAAPDTVAQDCDVGIECLGAAHAGVTGAVDILAFNRVVALGMDDTAGPSLIDEIIALYRKHSVPRFFVQLSPFAVPGDLPQWLVERGFQRYNNWVKLYRDVTLLPPVTTDLQIREIGPDRADAFASVMVTSFEWPECLCPWIAATVGRPGWHHYMAFDGETPVATGAVYCRGDFGWIDFASTLPAYRGHGAQAAIVEQRIRDAAALGCKWLIVETAEETPEKPAPSFRNMVRYGFKVAYARPNYLFTFES